MSTPGEGGGSGLIARAPLCCRGLGSAKTAGGAVGGLAVHSGGGEDLGGGVSKGELTGDA